MGDVEQVDESLDISYCEHICADGFSSADANVTGFGILCGLPWKLEFGAIWVVEAASVFLVWFGS